MNAAVSPQSRVPGAPNALATWSLTLALASIVTCSVSAFPAFILAVRALRQCAARPGHYRNARAAWAGLALSSVTVAALVVVCFASK
jgi:hypothetical protein